jgi:poly-gamma-glutamate synthesis protein (capsule biosynthesis protein)
MTDAGADIVVGTHAHRLQGLGYLDEQFVAYGLSNFVFKASSPEARRSGVLTVTATGRRIDGHRWAPAELRDNVPRPLSGDAAAAERAAMDALRGCTGLSATPGGPEIGG